jgi:hypothetical protein
MSGEFASAAAKRASPGFSFTIGLLRATPKCLSRCALNPSAANPRSRLSFHRIVSQQRRRGRIEPAMRSAALASCPARDSRRVSPARSAMRDGMTGTVGRVVYTDGRGGVTATYRFCAKCWPEESARHQARWEEESRLRMEASLRGRAPSARGSSCMPLSSGVGSQERRFAATDRAQRGASSQTERIHVSIRDCSPTPQSSRFNP